MLNLTTRAALVTRRSESPRESKVETPGFAAWLLPIGVWLVVLAENMGVIEASEFARLKRVFILTLMVPEGGWGAPESK